MAVPLQWGGAARQLPAGGQPGRSAVPQAAVHAAVRAGALRDQSHVVSLFCCTGLWHLLWAPMPLAACRILFPCQMAPSLRASSGRNPRENAIAGPGAALHFVPNTAMPSYHEHQKPVL